MKYFKIKYRYLLMAAATQSFLFVSEVFARGGGGGSGGGGGGGGGGGHGGSGGGIENILVFVVAIGIAIYTNYIRKKRIEAAKRLVEQAEKKDSVWNDEKILARVKEVFYEFQTAWSKLDDKAMKPLLTDEYYKRMVLELNVLMREGRKNEVLNPNLISVKLFNVDDEEDNTRDSFVVEVIAQANDILYDTALGKELYVDMSTFTEYWQFFRENDIWVLGKIRQSTENTDQISPAMQTFSDQNKFYFDADFGWLMMPNKGVLFKKSNFKTSDINNHVIGYYRKTIVEFYTFIPNGNSQYSRNYFVGQAILPIAYKNILIKKRKWFNPDPAGLQRIELESADFNKKFCLWADPADQVSSLELLTPNFMEKIYELPFDLNIEIVGSFLYFYTTSMPDDGYNKMLEILTWAFDEMRI